MKSAFLASVTLALAGIGLAACGQDSSEPTEPAAEVSPDALPGIAVTGGRLVLPAVKGNPGAVYFEAANNGEKDTAIVGAFVDGAKEAMLHASVEKDGVMSMNHMDQVPLAKGGTVSFAPGGNHVMVFELADTLAVGGTTEVTLTFANGDKASFNAEILGPGEAR